MHYLTALSQMPREVWIAAGVGAAVAFFVAFLLMVGGRRRYVVVRSSPATELFAYQMGRVADALERVAFERTAPAREARAPEPQPEPEPPGRAMRASEVRPVHRVSMSMFGR